MATASGPSLRSVSLTEARNLSPIFDQAVREQHPVLIVRNQREWGVLVARDAMLRMLAPNQFHVHVVPEDDGTYTLWLDELNVGASGATLRDARTSLLSAVRSYVEDYLRQFDFYRHLPDRARLEPFVVRLSLARDDAELIGMLWEDGASGASEPSATTA